MCQRWILTGSQRVRCEVLRRLCRLRCSGARSGILKAATTKGGAPQLSRGGVSPALCVDSNEGAGPAVFEAGLVMWTRERWRSSSFDGQSRERWKTDLSQAKSDAVADSDVNSFDRLLGWNEAANSCTSDDHQAAKPLLKLPTSECVLFDADRVSEPLVLRAWQAGDRLSPRGMKGKSKKLQDFFTDRKMARQERGKIPLFVAPEGLLWVVGMRQDERFRRPWRDNTVRCLVATVKSKSVGEGVKEHGADFRSADRDAGRNACADSVSSASRSRPTMPGRISSWSAC